jgi:hypothetical protein
MIERSYEVEMKRVRLLVQRYVLLLHPAEQRTGGLAEAEADVFVRCLFDLPLTEKRQEAIARAGAALEAAQSLSEESEGLRVEFGLSPLELDLLWLVAAPVLNPALGTVYATLFREQTLHRIEQRVLTRLLSPDSGQLGAILSALEEGGALVGEGLLLRLAGEQGAIHYAAAPSLLRHLTGATQVLPEPGELQFFPAEGGGAALPDLGAELLKRVRVGLSTTRRFILSGQESAGGVALARQLLAGRGEGLLKADVAAIVGAGQGPSPLILEAKLRRAGLYLCNIEALAAHPRKLGAWLALLRRCRVPVFIQADHGLSFELRLELMERLSCVELLLKLPDAEARRALWHRHLSPWVADEATRERIAFASRVYPFGAEQIEKAVRLGVLRARRRDVKASSLLPADVEGACHQISAGRLGDSAQRVSVQATWSDVVLGSEAQAVVEEMIRHGRYQEQVLTEQGYGERHGYGQGITALFWGPPGTGKTFVSGLLARELGLDLYRVDLSQIVSKYIGETEKHLAQLFDEASFSGTALLFDEADSLFASRTEVKSSVDRYANLEVNFLLQRLERHDGLVILTTNLAKSIDEAFMRRIRFKAHFPLPSAEERQRLWRALIPARAPLSPCVDFEALGASYEMSGGAIRNAVLRAAFYAAEAGDPLKMKHIDAAARVEYREAGRLFPTLPAYGAEDRSW